MDALGDEAPDAPPDSPRPAADRAADDQMMWKAMRAEMTNKMRRKAGQKEDEKLAELARKATEHKKREFEANAKVVRTEIAVEERQKDERRREEASRLAAAAAEGKRARELESEAWRAQAAARRKRHQAMMGQQTGEGDSELSMQQRAEAMAEIQRLREELNTLRKIYDKRCNEVITMKKAMSAPFGQQSAAVAGVPDEQAMRLEEQDMMLLAKEARLGGLETRVALVGAKLESVNSKVRQLKDMRRRVYAEALELMSFRADFSTGLLKMKDVIETVESEFNVLAARLQAMTRERDVLVIDIDEKRQTIQRLKDEVAETKAAHEKLKEEMKHFIDSIKALEHKCAELEGELGDLRAEMRKREEEHARELEELKAAHAEELGKVQEEKREVEQRLEAETKAFTEQLAAKETQRAEAEKGRLEAMRKQRELKDSYEKKLSERTAELRDLKQQASADKREAKKAAGGLGKVLSGIDLSTPEMVDQLLIHIASSDSLAHSEMAAIFARAGQGKSSGGVSPLHQAMGRGTAGTDRLARNRRRSEGEAAERRGDPHASIEDVVERLYARAAAFQQSWDRKRAEFLAAYRDHIMSLEELTFPEGEEQLKLLQHERAMQTPVRSPKRGGGGRFLDFVKRRGGGDSQWPQQRPASCRRSGAPPPRSRPYALGTLSDAARLPAVRAPP
eukprot:TRINITY_DN56667_c0_g1_i1.p1 TRINITY_DN56667_c0_g1~~TRINITY_DN56667_c0_g1_i1.p1  ORF type:complete len:703 (+),score=229.63 TRINITY_DN56667_c0_g1_i1:77-2110(+)